MDAVLPDLSGAKPTYCYKTDITPICFKWSP